MNYKLRIYFPDPPKNLPDFERIMVFKVLGGAVDYANSFLRITNTKLVSYPVKTDIAVDHVQKSLDLDTVLDLAIRPITGDGPVQIMSFTKTEELSFGEELIFPKPESKIKPFDMNTKHQDELASTLKSVPYFNSADIEILKRQIELANRERARNLRYQAIDKLLEIRERYYVTNGEKNTPTIESMLDEMVGSMMNLQA